MDKDFLSIKAMERSHGKADEFSYPEIKITWTLKKKVINYITLSYSPRNHIVDVAKHIECVLCAEHCFNALCMYSFNLYNFPLGT